MNPIREKTEYVSLKSLIAFLKLFPEGFTDPFFKCFGALAFCFSFRRRGMTLKNLAIAFPEKSKTERLRIAWRAFQNMALFSGESFLILAGKLTPEKIRQRVDASDMEKFKKLTENAEHGSLLLTGHLGNWEMQANFGAVSGIPVNFVARRGSNRLIDEKIIVPLRTRYGNRLLYKQNAMLYSVKALKRGETVCFLIDQKINRKEGEPAVFFGREIMAVSSCATIQIRYKPVVFPSFMIKTGKRKYKWVVGDPIEWTDDGSPQEQQVRKLTQIYQSCIEQMIREYPDQWFWMHNRFKLPDARSRRRKRKRAREAKKAALA